MERTEIKFDYDKEKLEAIKICITDKGANLNDELSNMMDVIYKKYVPEQIRDYIEKKSELSKKENPKQARRGGRKCRAISGDFDGSVV